MDIIPCGQQKDTASRMFVHFFRGGLPWGNRPVGFLEGLSSAQGVTVLRGGNTAPSLPLKEDLMKGQFLKVKLSHSWNWNASPSLSSVPTMESQVLIFKLSVGTFSFSIGSS